MRFEFGLFPSGHRRRLATDRPPCLLKEKARLSIIADAGTGGFWYNTTLAKAEELRSLDEFLNPKWKGKIGFLDPRTPGSGQSIWSFLWDIKGQD